MATTCSGRPTGRPSGGRAPGHPSAVFCGFTPLSRRLPDHARRDRDGRKARRRHRKDLRFWFRDRGLERDTVDQLRDLYLSWTAGVTGAARAPRRVDGAIAGAIYARKVPLSGRQLHDGPPLRDAVRPERGTSSTIGYRGNGDRGRQAPAPSWRPAEDAGGRAVFGPDANGTRCIYIYIYIYMYFPPRRRGAPPVASARHLPRPPRAPGLGSGTGGAQGCRMAAPAGATQKVRVQVPEGVIAGEGDAEGRLEARDRHRQITRRPTTITVRR